MIVDYYTYFLIYGARLLAGTIHTHTYGWFFLFPSEEDVEDSGGRKRGGWATWHCPAFLVRSLKYVAFCFVEA